MTYAEYMKETFTIKVVKALTNEKGEIYDGHAIINWEFNVVERNHTFYISDVAVIGGNRLVIINRGTFLVEPSWKDLSEYDKLGAENIKKAREEFRASREA